MALAPRDSGAEVHLRLDVAECGRAVELSGRTRLLSAGGEGDEDGEDGKDGTDGKDGKGRSEERF
jgi:hypothetical protein